MRRVIHRKTTTIKIVSVTLTWSDGAETDNPAIYRKVLELPAGNAESTVMLNEQQPKEKTGEQNETNG
jgi:hypothetical protein